MEPDAVRDSGHEAHKTAPQLGGTYHDQATDSETGRPRQAQRGERSYEMPGAQDGPFPIDENEATTRGRWPPERWIWSRNRSNVPCHGDLGAGGIGGKKAARTASDGLNPSATC